MLPIHNQSTKNVALILGFGNSFWGVQDDFRLYITIVKTFH